MSALASVERDLRAAVAADIVAPTAAYLTDMTEARGLSGRADAVALPRTAEEVAEVVAWCYAHGVAIVPRGGGTGYAAGAVPLDGGVVLSLERLDRVRSFDPLLWRIEVEAGLRTAELRRIAREGGLLFAPDPGAAEQSQIGGNIATNAGGPHAFKYGVTGKWVTGLEVVVPPGDVVRVAPRNDLGHFLGCPRERHGIGATDQSACLGHIRQVGGGRCDDVRADGCPQVTLDGRDRAHESARSSAA